MSEGFSSAETEFYVPFGKALSTWAYVEWLHSELFQIIATGQAANKPLERAYWAIVSFEGRHKMVHAALTEALSQHPSFLKRWTSLNNRLHTKSKQRNRLAHAQLALFPHKGGTVAAMVQAIYSGGTVSDDRKITVKDIIQMEEGFDRLATDLLAFQEMFFVEQMMEKPRPIPRYAYPIENAKAEAEGD